MARIQHKPLTSHDLLIRLEHLEHRLAEEGLDVLVKLDLIQARLDTRRALRKLEVAVPS